MRVMIAIGQLNCRCGPSVHGIRLVRQLRAMGHEPFLVHRTPDGDEDREVQEELSEALLPLSSGCHPLHPKLSFEFHRHLRSTQPQVVVFQLQTSMYNLAPVARRHRVKTMYMAGNVLQYNARWMQRTLPWLCDRYIDFLGGCSNEVVGSFVAAGYSGPTGRIPLGVDWPEQDYLRDQRSLVRGELGYSDDETVFCTVGRLVADKQQITLMQACRELRERGREFRFLIVGDGTAREDLERYCEEARLTDTVHFAGWQPDVFPYLAAADAFAFHSTDTAEGLGAVNLEAAGLGLPLVLADLKCLREIWPDGDDVLFAPVGDANAFADCMDELIDSPERRREIGHACAQTVRANYSCEAMAEAYLKVFEELVE